MKTFHHSLVFFVALLGIGNVTNAQNSLTATAKSEIDERKNPLNGVALDPTKKATAAARRENKVVAITGVRFAYPLVQKWIDDYNKTNPDVQIIIESRGTSDPAQYDILIEAYEPDAEIKKKRDYVYIGRYAIIPVANSLSAFSKVYAKKGLNEDLIKQLFFHDIFSDKNKQEEIKSPFTVYTRLQKAGAPITFTKYFGYEQKDIRGKAIAGSDEHLLKAVLRDSTGVSYFPLNLIYDHATGKPNSGLTVLPVDLNGNGKVSDDEKFYDDLSTVIPRLEEKSQKDTHNIPVEYLNLSVDKNGSSPEAVAFLQWVIKNGQNDLHTFGFLKPEQARLEKEKQDEFISKGKK
jgi:phosphate transport system substrate-binding protein